MASFRSTLPIETSLAPTELGDVDVLVREAGWNQVAADWKIFLELGTVYAVRTSAGRVIATAATIPYGGRFAWISMVLVSNDHKRQGLATRLLHRCVHDLTAAGLIPVLDATPTGKAIYRPLGFEEGLGYHRLAFRERWRTAEHIPAPEGATIRAIAEADLPAICAYDAVVFGADRAALITHLRSRMPGAALVAERQGKVIGFLLGRDGRSATQLGPLIAEDAETARALLAHALDTIEGPIYIDLADSKQETRAWLGAHGFATVRPLTRMIHRRKEGFDDPARTFAVAGPEFG